MPRQRTIRTRERFEQALALTERHHPAFAPQLRDRSRIAADGCFGVEQSRRCAVPDPRRRG